jgi:hypothetical protein
MNPPRFAFELDFLELTDHVPRTLGDSRMPCDMKWPPGPLLFFKQWMDEERCLEVSHLSAMASASRATDSYTPLRGALVRSRNSALLGLIPRDATNGPKPTRSTAQSPPQRHH